MELARECETFRYGNLVIDTAAWEVVLDGSPIELTKTEYRILVALASQPRRVVTNDELTEILWGKTWYGDENNLAVHICKLRSKLGESGQAPRYLRTVRGVGYRFEPPGSANEAGFGASRDGRE